MAASGLTRYGDNNEAGARKRQIYFPFVSESSSTRAGTSLSASAASGHRTGTAGAQRGEAALRSYKKPTQEASQTRARPRAQRPRTGRGATACGAVREEKKPNTPGISLRYSRRLAGQGPFSNTAPSLITLPPPFPTARQGPEPTAIPRQTRPRHDSPLSRREPNATERCPAAGGVSASCARPRGHSFPSLWPRPANQRARRAGTDTIDRPRQPIAAR